MRKIVLVLFSLLLPAAAQAEPSMCKLGGFDKDGTFVDIAAFYKNADLVVTGKVNGMADGSKDLNLQVERTLKGQAGKEIVLHGQQPLNTEMNGFALPGNKEVLLFLKTGATGAYDSVEDYNSPCNITFFVKDGKAVLIEKDQFNAGKEVAVDELKTFLEASPPKLVYKYQ